VRPTVTGFVSQAPAMLQPMTERQAQILRFIHSFQVEHRYPPTIRDICEAFKIRSPNGVMCHLRALERKGQIVRDEKVSRGIRLLVA
jgi:repressor LexA